MDLSDLSLGFLDFTSLETRREVCNEEVRLNRRLAPDVYLGVVSIGESGGRLEVEAEGSPVDYAVKMVRLPDEAALLEYLSRDELEVGVLAELGRRIASFHAGATSGPHVEWAICSRQRSMSRS